ncbi:DUF5683 domain-containing protein [Cytophagaceae bacterium ABcell3]|nr:DUF5683 domain-containing protein [Cytophagaceae bacterium ABcell3]
MSARLFFILIPVIFFLTITEALAQVPEEVPEEAPEEVPEEIPEERAPEFNMELPPDTVVREEPPASAEPVPPVRDIEEEDVNRIPRQRALMSAILPGLGQTFNRKYWKLPILYGAGVAMGYLISYNHSELRVHQALLDQVRDDPAAIDEIDRYNTEDAIRVQRDFYRRDRDMFIVVSGLVYALNIIDAYVDAHMKTFDLSDDLSMNVRPALLNNNSYFCPGLSINLNFKK